MFDTQKNIKNNNGDIETISITSTDNYKTLNPKQKYILVSETKKKKNQ